LTPWTGLNWQNRSQTGLGAGGATILYGPLAAADRPSKTRAYCHIRPGLLADSCGKITRGLVSLREGLISAITLPAKARSITIEMKSFMISS